MFKLGKKKSKSPTTPLDVALVGCGPAGMMFLHALNQRKKQGAENLPNVTCYELHASAGGVWKDVPEDDKERTKEDNKCIMYDDMWTNVPKELMEFYDYTFDEHFKKPTPAFLPRKDVLEYLIARHSVDGALEDVKFNHEVTDVTYDEGTKKFNVTVENVLSKEKSSEKYDRVIYAGGVQSEPEIPPDALEVLEGYEGKVIHSSEAIENPQFEKLVKEKNILMIGDSSSAEDLTLRAIKHGANKITIAARRGLGDCAETGSWPDRKAEVIYAVPFKLLKDKKSFKCQCVYWSEKRQKWRRDDEEPVIKIKDVDIVILCTGYDTDLDYFHDDIRVDLDETWEISKGWKMSNNSLTVTVGNISPNKKLWVGHTLYPSLYQNLFIPNPNMIYLIEPPDTYAPLIDLDVAAWLVLSYLTGEVEVPKEKDMRKFNQKQMEAEMQIPYMRVSMDYEYFAEVDEFDENHWSENAADERSILLERMDKDFKAKRLAGDMKLAKYPVSFGKSDKLNAMGEKYVDLCVAIERSRSFLNKESKEAKWKTFRDGDPESFVSLYTDTKACALPARWLDLEVVDENSPSKLDNFK